MKPSKPLTIKTCPELQERLTEWCRTLNIHGKISDDKLSEANIPCPVCHLWVPEDYAKLAEQSDLHLVRYLVDFFRIYMETVIVKEVTDERNEAREQRDHARAQLEAIGRKAFWAAK